MAIDVLAAAAAQEAAWLTCNNSNYLTNISNINNQITNVTIAPANAQCWNLWQNIPQLRDVSCAVQASCICNVNGGVNCWLPCTITVPAGATVGRFMIWGAGAGSGGGNCCTFAPGGATGAFASVVMPVTAGETYCLMVGQSANCCQYCCGCATWVQNGYFDGTRTYITGPGLCNFCADGGEANLWESMKARACAVNCTAYINAGCCKYYDLRNTTDSCCGGCICYNSTVCMFGYALGPYNCVNHQGSYTKKAYGCTTRNSIVWTIPSIYTGHVADSNAYGAGLQVPTYSPMQQAACYDYTYYTYTSTCNACNTGLMWCSNICVPGQGGQYTTTFGGCTAIYGARGRGGKACIQFLNL
jgi:hypothetical protein